jgi:hypothetical protein
MKHLLLILLMASQSCEEKTDVSFPRPTVIKIEKIPFTDQNLKMIDQRHESDLLTERTDSTIEFLNDISQTDSIYIYERI